MVSFTDVTDERIALYELDRPALTDWVVSLGQPRYRADQLWRWLYLGLVQDFEAMTDLPRAFRAELEAGARLSRLELVASTESQDSPAVKYLFRLSDGQQIETVLMHFLDPADAEEDESPSGGDSPPAPAVRHTVCLSTQAGCAMGCVFCATGQMGLQRDLSVGECIEQVIFCARRLRQLGQPLSNVVFMGMGEPLANWAATWSTVERLTDADGLALGARRITISTVGIVPGIRRLATAGKPVRLAVSLHAPDNALRDRLVAVNRTYDLEAILAACRDYQAAGGRRITFEYVLIDGVNDRPAQARALAARLLGLRAHVNLIPLNPTQGSPLLPSPYDRALAFETALQAAGIGTTLRMRRGIDVQAGCGQLRSRVGDGRLGRSIPLFDATGEPA